MPGGPLEFVIDGVNGAVVAPQPEAVADAINRLRRRIAPARPRRTATPAMRARRSMTWDGVIEKLTLSAP